jgi:hypothetical protein
VDAITIGHLEAALDLARAYRQFNATIALAMAAARLAGAEYSPSNDQPVTVFQAARNVVQDGIGTNPDDDMSRLRSLLRSRGFVVEDGWPEKAAALVS